MAAQNTPVFDVLLKHDNLDLEIKNAEGQTVLWFALKAGIGGYDDDSFAAKLVKRGSCVDAVCPLNGLFHFYIYLFCAQHMTCNLYCNICFSLYLHHESCAEIFKKCATDNGFYKQMNIFVKSIRIKICLY